MDLINDTSQTKWEMGKTAPKRKGRIQFKLGEVKCTYCIKRVFDYFVCPLY